MEVLAAAALVGLMAVAAARPMRLAALGSVEAKTTARRLSLDLLRARRLAIATGTPHQLVFQHEQGAVIGYQIRRGGNDIRAEVALTRHIQVNSAVDIEFLATGEADVGAEIEVSGTQSSGTRWKVTIARATGSVFVDTW